MLYEVITTVVLTLDELEALRLADLEGLYQEAAARQMGVSRQTFGRIVTEARKKSAQALVNGAAVITSYSIHYTKLYDTTRK